MMKYKLFRLFILLLSAYTSTSKAAQEGLLSNVTDKVMPKRGHNMLIWTGHEHLGDDPCVGIKKTLMLYDDSNKLIAYGTDGNTIHIPIQTSKAIYNCEQGLIPPSKEDLERNFKEAMIQNLAYNKRMQLIEINKTEKVKALEKKVIEIFEDFQKTNDENYLVQAQNLLTGIDNEIEKDKLDPRKHHGDMVGGAWINGILTINHRLHQYLRHAQGDNQKINPGPYLKTTKILMRQADEKENAYKGTLL
ncbi:MAG: hypothetical protein P4L22_04870 [Candidatus Babeliales bacterium]|nr:hypothetical protein [Candidatus Babeliales bacterium]